MELQERTDLHPNCPHCKAELRQLFFRKLKSTLGQRYVYFCSACHSVLGVSHRKGFWMG